MVAVQGLEPRTEAYLADSVFEVLKKHGEALVALDLAAAAAEAVCQGEKEVLQLMETGSHSAYHSPADELRAILCQSLPFRQNGRWDAGPGDDRGYR